MKAWTTLNVMACALALGACDPQAGQQYAGEPLLTMTGSVELALEVENQSELIPALAFRSGMDDTMYVVDAEVQGEFPAEFTLNVYQPPPAEAIYDMGTRYPRTPRVAVGYITAITPDTPRTFRFGSVGGGQSGCRVDDSTQLRVCVSEEEWCTQDESDCYTEVRTCPDSDNHPDDCTVEAEGNPDLKGDSDDMFAGISENYAVIWLEEAAAPLSPLAYEVGQRDEGLAAGYHLIATTEGEETEEGNACDRQAEGLALERTNAQLGAAFTLDDIIWLEDGDPAYEAFTIGKLEARIELDCPSSDETIVTHVDHPASEHISVRIGPEATGF